MDFPIPLLEYMYHHAIQYLLVRWRSITVSLWLRRFPWGYATTRTILAGKHYRASPCLVCGQLHAYR